MKIDVFTLFPEWFDWFAAQRHVDNVLQSGSQLQLVNPRDHTPLSGRQVDDTPFGGGAGMVLRVDVMDAALRGFYNTDPVDRIGIQHGFSQLYPAQVMSAWVTDSPNLATARRTPLRFRFHVAMAGVLGIGGDLTAWTEDEQKEAAELVAAYKRARSVVQHGTAYRLHGDVRFGAVVCAGWIDGHDGRRAEFPGFAVAMARCVISAQFEPLNLGFRG